MSPATCLTLVCLQRARLTQFHQLKSVVCKACLREDRRIASRQVWQPLHSGGSRQGLGRKAGLTTWLQLWFLRKEHVGGFLGEFVIQSCFGWEPFWGLGHRPCRWRVLDMGLYFLTLSVHATKADAEKTVKQGTQSLESRGCWLWTVVRHAVPALPSLCSSRHLCVWCPGSTASSVGAYCQQDTWLPPT